MNDATNKAKSRLAWCAAMRDRLDEKLHDEIAFIRAWFFTVDGRPERRMALADIGERDAADFCELIGFLQDRVTWIEAGSFRYIGLFEKEPVKPDRSPAIKLMTLADAARLYGNGWNDDLAVLFAGNSRPKPRRHRTKEAATG